MISFSHINKQYGRQVLFLDASFQLNPGEKVGLVGPNGAGKTTLFRMITGEETPDEDRKSTRLNSSHLGISYAVFCLKKKKKKSNHLSLPSYALGQEGCHCAHRRV